jgi:hypothetical protein
MSNSKKDTKAELNHALLAVHADVGVATTLLHHLQRDTEHLPEIYNLCEALSAVLSRVGYLNTHVAHLASPGVLDKPDAEIWMPTLGLTKGAS